jgi:replicative DNA helicase
MIDVILLRILRHRKDFSTLYPMIPREGVLDKKTVALADDFRRYFETFPSHTEVDLQTFLPRFAQWHSTMGEEDIRGYTAVFQNCMLLADADQKRAIYKDLADVHMATRLANLATQHNEGDTPDLYGALNQITDQYRQTLGFKNTAYIDTPIDELLQEEFNDAGISWRLEAINRSMRKLRPGDFGIVAGRPDKGKTSFLASEVTYWAPQLPKGRNILWLNNEGPGRRILPRLYQAALNMSMVELKAASSHGTLNNSMRTALGGDISRIRVFDIHGMNTGQVELIIAENNAGIIIYDMIDSIRGFGGEARTDLALEEMYKWARERSVKYDCIGIATSQISNDGDGLMFPTLGMLKDSKTGKQGACDFQLMIGASNDAMLSGERYISLPKNKLRKPDGPSDPRATVLFDGTRSRYNDVPIGV